MTKTCELCGAVFARRDNEWPAKWSRRRYCSQACSARAHLPAAHKASAILGHKYVETRRADLVEDVEFLIQYGATPDEVATRLGRTVGAIARGLYRSERPDLARPFERLRKERDRAKVCADCGAKCSHYQRGEVTRCRVCAQRARWAA